MSARRVTTWLLAGVLASCGSEEATTMDGGSHGDADAGPIHDAFVPPPREGGPLPDGSRPHVDDDGNRTFADALPLELGGPSLSGTVSGADDFDYLRFEATEGQYLAVMLIGTDGESPSFYAAALTVLDPEMRPLAEARDHNGCANVPESTLELVTRAARSGTYYVEVFDPTGGFLDAVLPWEVRVVDLATSEASLIVEEGRPPGAITAAHRCVLGAFEELGDEDRIPLALPAYRVLFPYTRARHGSTGTVSAMELLDAGGARVGSHPTSLLIDDVTSPVLRLLGPEVRGANDHYLLTPDSPTQYGPHVFHAESADVSNDSHTTPEVLDLPPPDEDGYALPFVTHLPPGDVDHFAVDITSRGRLDVACQARTIGSALDGLTVTLLDEAGTELARGREVGSLAAHVGTELPPGRYLLRLTSSGRIPDLSGNAALCGISPSW